MGGDKQHVTHWTLQTNDKSSCHEARTLDSNRKSMAGKLVARNGKDAKEQDEVQHLSQGLSSNKEAMKQLQETQDATLCEIENERPELSVKMQEIDTLHTAAVQRVREREQFEEIREQKEQHQKKLKSTLDETIHEPSKHGVRHQTTT